jgi:2-polyprenyl-6-methoxyphenol hydroxylase-like FAD-dependent oxidoreductase
LRTQVLIVGAGPTGLVLALWLARQGVAVRIVDQAAAPGTTSRALAVQARTLELYRQLDLTEEVVARGHKTPGVNLWTEGEKRARLDFETVGEDLTPYSFLHIFPQDEHEALLIERLARLGVSVERKKTLTAFVDRGGGITARLSLPDGREETIEADYLAGCDGARSAVRHGLGVGFPGGTYRQVFYVADISGRGPTIDGELHVDLDEADFLAVFPLTGEGRARLIGTVRDERADHAETLTFQDVSRRAMRNLRFEVDRVNWFSTYHVHHRVVERFRVGRALLVGDAAHIHSPAGGQGMNTGIGDAINLAWKLAAVLAGRADDRLLDSYEEERAAFAKRLVVSTDRAFSIATAEGRLADIIRTRIAPAVLPTAFAFEPFREFAFRTVSQITLNYRHMALSQGKAGEVEGGDRLPWARGTHNYESLNRIEWQVHLYGQPNRALAAWCAARGLPLHTFGWFEPYQKAGLAEDAAYLIRPDTYVALADRQASPDTFEQYFEARGLRAH